MHTEFDNNLYKWIPTFTRAKGQNWTWTYMYVPRSEISLWSNRGQIRSKLLFFAVIRLTHLAIWVCGKVKMFAVSWIDINMILNMNIWSAQQNDNSNERALDHTNLIISYRFGFLLEFNFEMSDFYDSRPIRGQHAWGKCRIWEFFVTINQI